MTRALLIAAALLAPGAARAAGCGSFIVTQPYRPPAAASPQDRAAEAAKVDAKVDAKADSKKADSKADTKAEAKPAAARAKE